MDRQTEGLTHYTALLRVMQFAASFQILDFKSSPLWYETHYFHIRWFAKDSTLNSKQAHPSVELTCTSDPGD